LGLPNKKYLIKEFLYDPKIDVMCIQETDISPQLTPDLPSLQGYFLESESNDTKICTGIYVKSTLNYVRRKDLESSRLHLVTIDLISKSKLRIINMYRPFNPWGFHCMGTLPPTNHPE
jgi:exonuclease III